MDYRQYYPVGLRLLSSLIDLTLVLMGLFIIGLVFTNATLRNAAGFDLAWSLEITAFLLLWSTFLGCAAAVARGAHMRVTEIVDSLMPLLGRRVLTMIINLIVIAMLISLVVVGFAISGHTWAQRTTVLYLPVGSLYASMPVGMTLSLIFHLFNVWHDLKNPPQAGDHGNPLTNDGSNQGVAR